MAYIGKIKERLTLTATLTNTFNYEKPAYTYGTEYHTIYIFTTEAGDVLKCDTTSYLSYDGRTKQEKADGEGWEKLHALNKGDVVELKGTVKDHREYNETPQTVIQRVNITKLIFKAETPEERERRLLKERKEQKQAQLDSIGDGDTVLRMEYRNYKEHYSDCETLIDSYDSGRDQRGDRYGSPMISVIVRAGRLKPSGVRGEHYSGYQLRDRKTGVYITYRAVCADNAIKRCKKENPDWDIELAHVFDYRR